MTNSIPNRPGAVAKALLDWYDANARPLPWRSLGHAPWPVLVSEIMAQQTQMNRVGAYFARFLERFPTPAELAKAHEDEVFALWQGLGYYSRARNLLRTARTLVEQFGGQVPGDKATLHTLPGVGEYTAAAVASIAFNADEPLVDANVKRVLARLFDWDEPIHTGASKAFFQKKAAELLPAGQAQRFNQAIMEFGSLVCRKKPLCDTCPLASRCRSLELGIVRERPVTGPVKAITTLYVAAGVLVHEGLVFIQKRLDEGAWAGLWEFPGGRIEPGETPDAAAVREFLEETGFRTRIAADYGLIRHGYTTFRVRLSCFGLEFAEQTPPAPVPALTAATAHRWIDPKELRRFALPAGHRKLAEQIWGGAE